MGATRGGVPSFTHRAHTRTRCRGARVTCPSSGLEEGEEEGGGGGLVPAVSAAGGRLLEAEGEEEEDVPVALGGRAAALRQMCVDELGASTFERVYSYLRDAKDDADDEGMRADLMRLMGESKLRFWPLVDQLVFIEDTSQPSPRPGGGASPEMQMGQFPILE